MTLPPPAALVVAATVLATSPAAAASEAENIAGRSGLILGAAMVCGLPDD